MSVSPRFADITTIGVGGAIAHFVEAHSRDEFINAVCFADDEKLPLLVIGGGSNLLVSDENFPGVVVRDARHAIHVLGSEAKRTPILTPPRPPLSAPMRECAGMLSSLSQFRMA